MSKLSEPGWRERRVLGWGGLEDVVTRVQEHLEAGADHVCIQVLPADPTATPRREWRELASALLASRNGLGALL